MRCVIVCPTYDEVDTIGNLLDHIGAVRADVARSQGHDLNVLVVDDASPDGTQDVVRAHVGFRDDAPSDRGWVHLLARTGKDGLGAAYRAGFAQALAEGYDAVVQLDADGSHPVETVPALLALLATHDVAIGSRYVPGGHTVNWPARRRLISWAANTYARTVLGLRTRDTTAGMRAWTAAAVRRAGVTQTTSSGYGFQVENTWSTERRGLRVAEHPITFTERTAGASKMTASIAHEAAMLVLTWKAQELRQRLLGRRRTGQAWA
ncbi:polyprenol monophosphomannose synthase [Nocardioides korecus]